MASHHKLSNDTVTKMLSGKPSYLAYEIWVSEFNKLFVHIDGIRSDEKELCIPCNSFKTVPGGPVPDFDDIEIIDDGHTIRLGQYEAAVDKLLYDHSPSYRHRIFVREMKQLFNRFRENPEKNYHSVTYDMYRTVEELVKAEEDLK